MLGCCSNGDEDAADGHSRIGLIMLIDGRRGYFIITIFRTVIAWFAVTRIW